MNPIEIYGPQGEYIVALIERARRLTDEEAAGPRWTQDVGRRDASRAARRAARRATRYAAWYAAWYAARDAAPFAEDAATALVVRDLISPDDFTQEHYDVLTGPWRQVIGPIHPDDDEVTR
jgi:hypothetical protein